MSAARQRGPQGDEFDIGATLASALSPVPVPLARAPLLQSGLMDRVRHSARVHRAFTTVRREDAVWTAVSPGVMRCALSAQDGIRVDLLKAAPGALIPWPAEAQAQEVLVTGGMLAVDDDGGAEPVLLSALQHAVLGMERPWRQTAGPAGASLYVRSRQVDLSGLPEGEAQWWRAAQHAALSTAGQPPAWAPYLDGVEAAVLQAHGEVASMLVSISPGATVPDHGHAQTEDCYMLEGDMFLGDILMRSGDYQLAPVGCQHVGIASDPGGLFYFHGAIPPTASELAK